VRALLFFAVFVVAVLLMAPLERWVLDAVRPPLEAVGAELRIGSLRLALPAGIRASDVGIEAEAGGLDIDSLYVGITRAVEAEACGGKIRGHVGRQSLTFDLDGIDPSRCLRVGKLALESTLSGRVSVDGVDLLEPRADAPMRARVDVTSSEGLFGGILEHAGRDGSDVPLGEWEFNDLVLHATFDRGQLDIEEGHATTSGVLWELVGAKLPSGDDRSGLRVDFRARQVEDNPRSRALLGLLPKGTADAAGWRNFRVTGSLGSPRVVAVD
jgi:type II secretion system protein N